ncbi:MAG: sigma 54-interacting transcriptional regulator [Deltaproteobacteria bacterium]|nr:sigma 54-interacting transcriptional regulator [Deltaproteobacteria bacterium]
MHLVFPESTAIPEVGFKDWTGKTSAAGATANQPKIMMPAQSHGSGEVTTSFGEIIGQSRAWREIIRQMEMVAPTDATVLIMGETGTGKELVANGLHQRSRRKHQPLV